MFEHFIEAQENHLAVAEAELRRGKKESHWMWFIFPQLGCLGRSATAIRYGIADINEAQVYARHPLLGRRLRACVALANNIEGRSAQDIFGFPDVLKFRSCLTLFGRATEEPVFREGITKFYGAAEDPMTLEALGLR